MSPINIAGEESSLLARCTGVILQFLQDVRQLRSRRSSFTEAFVKVGRGVTQGGGAAAAAAARGNGNMKLLCGTRVAAKPPEHTPAGREKDLDS